MKEGVLFILDFFAWLWPILIFDGVIIGTLAFRLVKVILGETPFSRFLRVIFFIVSAVGYIYLTNLLLFNYAAYEVGNWIITLILTIGPIVTLMVFKPIFWFYKYIIGSKN